MDASLEHDSTVSNASNASNAGNTVIDTLYMFMFVLLLRTFIGMFGAVEDGQEEAVRFFEAWKAEVV